LSLWYIFFQAGDPRFFQVDFPVLLIGTNASLFPADNGDVVRAFFGLLCVKLQIVNLFNPGFWEDRSAFFLVQVVQADRFVYGHIPSVFIRKTVPLLIKTSVIRKILHGIRYI
jgi:hypothetical protein